MTCLRNVYEIQQCLAMLPNELVKIRRGRGKVVSERLWALYKVGGIEACGRPAESHTQRHWQRCDCNGSPGVEKFSRFGRTARRVWTIITTGWWQGILSWRHTLINLVQTFSLFKTRDFMTRSNSSQGWKHKNTDYNYEGGKCTTVLNL